MKGLSAKSRVTFGLVGLAVSALLLAAMLDLVPDRVGAVREGRAALAEVLASASTGWVAGDDMRRAEETLRLAVERSSDMLSAAMRRNSGTTVVQVGEHESLWETMPGKHSSDTQLRVPVLSGASKWGELELRFRPLLGEGAWSLAHHPLLLLTAFMALSCSFGFYFYLSKALTQLDPSKAVPGRVRSALDTMAEGLLVIDRGGRIVLANRAFAAVVGRDTDSLVGMQPANLPFEGMDESGAASARFPWIRALETGAEEYAVPMRLRDASDNLRALMVNCSPVAGASGRPGGVLVSFDDVTELEARGEELREAKDEADEANRAKSAFLANMSHEIRTPMNAILGFTEVLRRGYQKNDQEWRTYLNTIHSSGTHLLELINDILDLSKVEAGYLEVESVRIDAYRVIQDVIKILGVKAKEKGIELGFEADSVLPETVISDPSRLRQIITNLVGNAIKFTASGSVTIIARLDDGGLQPMLEVSVRDTGIGIPAEKLDTVFEAFAQADTSVTRRFGGTGLGLPISRRFARAMGGDVTVSSVVGEGSTFTLRVPTGPLEGVAMLEPRHLDKGGEAADGAQAQTWTFAPARVLLVDDAPENRALLAVVLDGTGLELAEAENGQHALDLAAETSFDLVLMDMQMPVMDGYTATRTLRERGFKAPVLALTAHAMKGYEQECRAAGCDDYVTKPIDIDGLMETLARWLPQGEHAEHADAQPLPGTRPAALPALVAGAGAAPLISRLAENPRMRPVVRQFDERLRTQVPTMREALLAGDLDAVAKLAHWLKGSAGTLGYPDFTEPARQLEEHVRAKDLEAAFTSVGILEALTARVQTPEDDECAAPTTVPRGALDGKNSVRTPAAAKVDTTRDRRPVVSALAVNTRMHVPIRLFGERLEAYLQGLTGEESLDELASMGHWLKGSAGTVGYTDFTEPAKALERHARAGDAAAAWRALENVRHLAARLELPAAPSGACLEQKREQEQRPCQP